MQNMQEQGTTGNARNEREAMNEKRRTNSLLAAGIVLTQTIAAAVLLGKKHK